MNIISTLGCKIIHHKYVNSFVKKSPLQRRYATLVKIYNRRRQKRAALIMCNEMGFCISTSYLPNNYWHLLSLNDKLPLELFWSLDIKITCSQFEWKPDAPDFQHRGKLEKLSWERNSSQQKVKLIKRIRYNRVSNELNMIFFFLVYAVDYVHCEVAYTSQPLQYDTAVKSKTL